MGARWQGRLASPTMTPPLTRPTTSLSGGVGVAAHSPATAAAGMALLDAGGTAADAAVGMTLAACAVEPFVVSLLSGLHGIHVDVDGTTRAVDGFVDVPAVPTGGRPDAAARALGTARANRTANKFAGVVLDVARRELRKRRKSLHITDLFPDFDFSPASVKNIIGGTKISG